MVYNLKSKNDILKKYYCKTRILFLITPNYQNKKYQKIKEEYDDNSYEFHKLFVKKITLLGKELNEPFIEVYDFDSSLIYNNITIKKLYNYLLKNKKSLKEKHKKYKCKDKPINLSLYTDYNPETTTPNLGFKNKEKAEYTIQKIKNRSIKYQIGVLNTLLGRAKSHPYQTDKMREAIKILQKYKNKILKETKD